MRILGRLTIALLCCGALVTANSADAREPGDPVVFFETPGNNTTITEPIGWGAIRVFAADPDVGTDSGDGISRVRLIVTDLQTGAQVYRRGDSQPVYGFVPDLADGTYSLRATAYSTPDAGGTRSNATVVVTVDTGGGGAPTLDLSLDRFQINQAVPALDSVQSVDHGIAPVARRRGLVRAFVSSNENGAPRPAVDLHWRRPNGNTGIISLSGPPTVPTVPAEGDLATTFNHDFGPYFFRSGLEIFVVVDPDDQVDETDESNNRWPTAGWASAEVEEVGELAVTWVPIVHNGVTGNVNAGNIGLYEDQTMRMMPIPGIDSQIHAPIVFNGNLSTSAGWRALLDQVAALKNAEGSGRAYHGIVHRPGSGGTVGIGFVGYEAAVSFDLASSASDVVAHEFGHNFGLSHAPCGNPDSPDPNYPYLNARLGVWGYDLVDRTLQNPGSDLRDLMSYCDPDWISDYHYGSVLANRLQVAARNAAFDGTALRISGSIDNGVATLGQAFALAGGGVLPVPGAYTLVGQDTSGHHLFEVPFTAYLSDIDENEPARFSISVPLAGFDPTHIASLRVEMDGVLIGSLKTPAEPALVATVATSVDNGDGTSTISWGSSGSLRSSGQVGVVSDTATGDILAISTAGTATVAATAAVDLALSNGFGPSVAVTVEQE